MHCIRGKDPKAEESEVVIERGDRIEAKRYIHTHYTLLIADNAERSESQGTERCRRQAMVVSSDRDPVQSCRRLRANNTVEKRDLELSEVFGREMMIE